MKNGNEENFHNSNDIWEVYINNEKEQHFLKLGFCKKYIYYSKHKHKPKLTDEVLKLI